MILFLILMSNLLYKEFDSEIQNAYYKKNNLFIISGTKIYNIDKNSFDLIWSNKKECAYVSGIEVTNGEYLISEWCGKLYLLDKDGHKIYEKTFDVPISGPFLFEDSIFVLAKDGNLYFLNKNNLDIIWKKSIGKPSYYWDSHFILVDQKLLVKYFMDDKFNSTLIDPSTGKEYWKVSFGFREAKSSGENIYFLLGEKRNIIYGLSSRNGNIFLKINFMKFIKDFGILDGSIYIISAGKIYFYDLQGIKLKEIKLSKNKGKLIFLKNNKLYLWDGKNITIYYIKENAYETINADLKDLHKKEIEIIEDEGNYLIIMSKNKIYKANYF